MRINPSVVIGLGSTGSYVVSNLERILYEVVGDVPLDLFRLISLDTDTRPKEDEPPPGGRRGISYSAHVADTGQAIQNLRQALGKDFNWCPDNLIIEGEGAGNLRSGGRLLLFSHFSQISQMIQQAAFEVGQAALQETSTRLFNQQFERRHIAPPENLINPNRTSVYLVGTLAGGTCSGMCVDLGYAIKDAAPQAERIGVFLVPGRTQAPVFLENTWATLKDLEFFCDNPSSFRSVWVSDAGARQRFEAKNQLPFDFAYLLSGVNEHGNQRMPYAPNSTSPLVVMASMHLAASLLGMNAHISASHVNIVNQVQTKPKNRFFLNYNLRAVSYPKYEISEAAACGVICDTICPRWLSRENYLSAGGTRPLHEEDVRAAGRRFWNGSFDQIWLGLSGGVEVKPLVEPIVRGASNDPAADLLRQLADPNQGTIFSQVYQVLSGRTLMIRKQINEGVGTVLQQNQNVRYAELYLEGIKEELEHTLRFWDAAGVPSREDPSSWSTVARRDIDALLGKYRILSKTLAAHEQLLSDEIENLLVRLRMYLMRKVLRDIQLWLANEISPWLATLRASFETVGSLANRRRAVLSQQMKELHGPILKLGRSGNESLASEIESLSSIEPIFAKPLIANGENGYVGIFAVKSLQDSGDNRKVFLALKNQIQPQALRALEAKGTVDVVQQIREQARMNQVVDHFRDAQSMSLETRLGLLKNPAAVPSFVLAKDAATAGSLILDMQRAMGNPPPVTAQPLPMFDHMVLFYQEGACSVQPGTVYQSMPEVLSDSSVYREHYDAKMQDSPQNLDPLASTKRTEIIVAGQE